MHFRPALWMTLFTVGSLVILIALGNWQVRRLHWKNQLIAQIDAGWAADAIPLAQLDIKAGKSAWQKVSLQGEYLTKFAPIRWYGTQNGKVGYKYLQAFILETGQVVMVNRGYAPILADLAPAPDKPVTLIGVLRTSESRGRFGVDNELEKNIWYYRDVPAMRPEQVPSSQFHAGYSVDLIETGKSSVGSNSWPQPTGKKPAIVNNHLDYALTWYGMALVLVVIYLLWHRREGRLKI